MRLMMMKGVILAEVIMIVRIVKYGNLGFVGFELIILGWISLDLRQIPAENPEFFRFVSHTKLWLEERENGSG
jgi:hypothetical protein